MSKHFLSFRIFLHYTLKSLWLYGPGVCTVLASYFVFTNLTQGQDILMQVGERTITFLFSVLAVLSWSFFIWYSSRLIGYEKKFIEPKWPTHFLSHGPRLLAYNAFVSIQAAMLALPTLWEMSFWPLLLFIAIHNGYYYCLFYTFNKETRNRLLTISTVVIALAYSIVLLSVSFGDADHQRNLPKEIVALFLLQIVCLFIFVKRRVLLDVKGNEKKYDDDAVGYVRVLWRPVIKIPAWFKEEEQRTFNLFNGVAIVAIIFFTITFLNIEMAYSTGPLAVVLLAFGILAGLANFITYGSLRTGSNLFLFLLLIAWLVGNFSKDPYEVQLTKASEKNIYDKRPDLKMYLGAWIEKRKDAINESTKYPVYLILADGGASRSGYWVASVLSAFQEESLKLNPNDPFSKHILCLSGASGGSVGNATFYAQLANKDTSEFVRTSQEFLKNDFLSFSIAHYLGPDLLRHLFPWIPVSDRAAAISETMDYWSDKNLQGAFGKNLNDVVKESDELPILFINTTRVQQGTPAVVSTIKLTDFSKRLDVLEKVDSTGITADAGNITLSTAAVLGARFPYISPAGKIGKHYFVDGGYFDNSGAGVVQEMMHSLDSLLKKMDSATVAKLDFKLIHITNTPFGETIEDIHPLANDIAAPLLTVFNTYASQTVVNDHRLTNYMSTRFGCDSCFHTVNLYKEKGEVYPMNWVISKYHLKKMNSRLDGVRGKEIKKILSKK